MNKEIETIVFDLGNYASNEKPQRNEHNVIIPFSLHYIDANLLFSYICELEEENKRLKELETQIKNQKELLRKQSEVIIPKNIKQHNKIVDINVRIKELEEENEHLKYRLNDMVFNDNNTDAELGARLLRKLGYCDFDEERKVYLNKHNNQPFLQEDEKEKGYYLKDDELDDYTKQLEYKINKAINKVQYIIDLGFDYDGFESPGDLKGLIDSLVDYAKKTKKILKGK